MSWRKRARPKKKKQKLKKGIQIYFPILWLSPLVELSPNWNFQSKKARLRFPVMSYLLIWIKFQIIPILGSQFQGATVGSPLNKPIQNRECRYFPGQGKEWFDQNWKPKLSRYLHERWDFSWMFLTPECVSETAGPLWFPFCAFHAFNVYPHLSALVDINDVIMFPVSL